MKEYDGNHRYEEALEHEFKLRGVSFERQKEIELDYKEKRRR